MERPIDVWDCCSHHQSGGNTRGDMARSKSILRTGSEPTTLIQDTKNNIDFFESLQHKGHTVEYLTDIG